MVRRTPSFRAGDLVRVLYVPQLEKCHCFWVGKLAVVRNVYGYRADCQRIIGAMPGVTREVRHEHMKRIDLDDLNDTEFAAYAAWRLSQ